MLSARAAAALYALLERHGIRFWVMGGWGVDALLRRETRPHRDLDSLVLLDDLPRLWNVLDEHGLALKQVWRESRWVGEGGDGGDGGDRRPTAFVAADGQDRELDVHVIAIGPDGAIVQYYDDPWPFPASITARGSIAGAAVTCVSEETQLAMHTGYPFPGEHLRDVALLQAD